MCVVTLDCYYFHVFDGSLHTQHMDAYTSMYLVSNVPVCDLTLKLCMCMCVLGVHVCAFAIYFSEWVAKYSYASCVSVCVRA